MKRLPSIYSRPESTDRALIPRLLFALFPVAILTIFLLAGCGEGQGENPNNQSQSPSAVTVDATEVAVEDVPYRIEGVGTLEAKERASVSSEVAGVVESIEFEEGDTVPRHHDGTDRRPVLVELRDELQQAEVDSAKAARASAQANLEEAEDEFSRVEMMYEDGAVTESEFTRAEIQRKRARAALREAEARVRQARERLSKTTIRAPITGRLGERRVSPGEYVSPGQSLVEVVQMDPVEIAFNVPERFRSRVENGQRVELEMDAYPGESFSGQISFLAPSVDSDSRSFRVKADIPNAEHRLQPGMFAGTSLITEVREQAPVVPDRSIVPRSDTFFVYIVEGGTAVRREVQLGQRFSDRVEILDGLEGGETVITAGHQMLQDGTPVSVRNP